MNITRFRAGAASTQSSPFVFWLVAAGALMTSLDLSIGNVALPAIARAYPSSSSVTLSWVLNAYTVAFGATLIVGGRLADAAGRRPVFGAGVLVFTVASAAIALSPSVGWLIAARAVQGLGAAAITPASLGLMIAVHGDDRRSETVGRWSGLHAGAVVLGPTLGGILIALGTWRLAFGVNVPVGIAVLLATHRNGDSQSARPRRRLDAAGTVLVSTAAGAGAFALADVRHAGIASAPVVSSVVVCVISVTALVRHQRRHPDPILDRQLLRDRWITATTIATFCYSAGYFAIFSGSILYVTNVWHYGHTAAGLAFTAGPALVVLTSRRAGRAIGKYGPGPFVTVGGCLLAAGAAWHWWRLGERANFLTGWLPGHLLTGLGVTTMFTAVGSAAVDHVPRPKLAVATGINQTARQLGGATGIALMWGLLPEPLPTTSGGYVRLWVLAIACTLAGAMLGIPLARWTRPHDRQSRDRCPAVPSDPRTS